MKKIYEVFKSTEDFVCKNLINEDKFLPEEIFFITTQELEDMYQIRHQKKEKILLQKKKVLYL